MSIFAKCEIFQLFLDVKHFSTCQCSEAKASVPGALNKLGE